MSIEAMKLALAALETCRIRSVSEWSVEDITPKNVTAAIAALRTAIQQAEAQQPATTEPMTDDEATAMIRETVRGNAIRREGSTSLQIVRATEDYYGITAQAKEDTP